MGKAVKLSNVCFNCITAAEYLIKKVNEEQNDQYSHSFSQLTHNKIEISIDQWLR